MARSCFATPSPENIMANVRAFSSAIKSELALAKNKTTITLMLLAVLAIIATTMAVPAIERQAQKAAANSIFVGSAINPSGGYWSVKPDGSVFSYGGAHFYGSMNGHGLNKPMVAMASNSTGSGYWLVASDGGVFAFGGAPFLGSMGGAPLNKPVVGMASTKSGNGYWLVASDGGVFAFGDAKFYGSMGGTRLNKPVVGMARSHNGNGYWAVASDGGIFCFGDAPFFGSAGSIRLAKPVTAMQATSTGNGYWLLADDGGIFSYGDAGYAGSGVGTVNAGAVSLVPNGTSYRIVDGVGRLLDPRPDPIRSSSATGGAATGDGPTNPGNWELIFEEQFNGTSLNERIWDQYYGAGNAGVGLRRPEANSVSDGALHITGRGDVSGGLCFCGPDAYEKTYGRWEVRARMDRGNGYGPAALLWPENNDSWPAAGEIDIAEQAGGDRTESSFTLHYDPSNKQEQFTHYGDFTQWHTYGVEWTPTRITYFFDGKAMWHTDNQAAIPDGPMHLALQNDVFDGSTPWTPARDASTPAEVAYHVDWVRMYK